MTAVCSRINEYPNRTFKIDVFSTDFEQSTQVVYADLKLLGIPTIGLGIGIIRMFDALNSFYRVMNLVMHWRQFQMKFLKQGKKVVLNGVYHILFSID